MPLSGSAPSGPLSPNRRAAATRLGLETGWLWGPFQRRPACCTVPKRPCEACRILLFLSFKMTVVQPESPRPLPDVGGPGQLRITHSTHAFLFTGLAFRRQEVFTATSCFPVSPHTHSYLRGVFNPRYRLNYIFKLLCLPELPAASLYQ